MRRFAKVGGVIAKTVLVGAASAAIFVAGLAVLLALIPSDEAGRPGRGVSDSVGAGILGGGEFASSDARGPRLAADSREESSGSVPVLCYHYLRPKTTPRQFARILGALFLNLPLLERMDVWTQTAEMFDAQMAFLDREGYETVDLTDIVEWRLGRRTLPPKPVVITFDDGDRSVLDLAFPILQKYGFKATLFIVTSRVGRKWERVDCLDWDELRRLRESGVFNIQSHSHDLHRKVKTSEGEMPVFIGARWGLHEMQRGWRWTDAVRDDLRRSRELIEREVGGRATCLAWPYGFADAALDSIAASAGYTVLCTLGEGSNYRTGANMPGGGYGDAQHVVRRYTMTARTSLRGFEALLTQAPRSRE